MLQMNNDNWCIVSFNVATRWRIKHIFIILMQIKLYHIKTQFQLYYVGFALYSGTLITNEMGAISVRTSFYFPAGGSLVAKLQPQQCSTRYDSHIGGPEMVSARPEEGPQFSYYDIYYSFNLTFISTGHHYLIVLYFILIGAIYFYSGASFIRTVGCAYQSRLTVSGEISLGPHLAEWMYCN